jgi:hypothetical protein
MLSLKKNFKVGEKVYEKVYFCGVLTPTFRFIPRTVLAIPDRKRKRYKVSSSTAGPIYRWPADLFSKEEVVAIKLKEE